MKYLFTNANLPLQFMTTDIAIIDNAIELAAGQEKTGFDRIIDLEGRMVVRGFCDLHTHLDKALISGKIANRSGTLAEAIRIMGSYKSAMSEEDIRQRAEKALRMCRANGTRWLRTHVDVDAGIGLKSLNVLKSLRQEYRDSLEIQIVAFPQEGIVDCPENYRMLEQALKEGADLVGGIPAIEKDPLKHIEMIFKLAREYDVDVDMHIDETDEAATQTLPALANAVRKNGWGGRVTAGHCCSLAAIPPAEQEHIAKLLHDARISIISLPSTNLYLQGRNDLYNIRRGITPVSRLDRAGISVSIASDNIQDPFNPFGTGNLLQAGLIAAHGCQMGGTEDLARLFAMTTRNPATVFGAQWEILEKQKPDFIVIDARSTAEAIVSQSPVFGSFSNGSFTRHGTSVA